MLLFNANFAKGYTKFLVYCFGGQKSWPFLFLCRPFMIFEGSLDSNPVLKVVGNEKEGRSGKWQMIDIGLGLW
jgi:hypothetical protein